jgi:26S proteasome regulatory subunit N6
MVSPTPADEARRIAEAQKVAKTNPAEAERIYKDILSRHPGQSDAAIKNFENALVALGALYRDQKKVQELADLVQQTRSALSTFAKAKTAKLGMNQS